MIGDAFPEEVSVGRVFNYRVGANGVVERMADGELDLAAMQEVVGGYIELVVPQDGVDVYVNEEGLLKSLPYNLLVSKLSGRVLVGDAVVCVREGTHLQRALQAGVV